MSITFNLAVFSVLGLFTIIYLKAIQPNLISKKVENHIKIINNTIDHIERLNIKFTENDVRKFLFSTRFLFQNIERVLIFDNDFKHYLYAKLYNAGISDLFLDFLNNYLSSRFFCVSNPLFALSHLPANVL